MNIDTIRRLFPITKEKIYLNHASSGPLTTRARNAMEELLDVYQNESDITKEMLEDAEEETRELAARLLGADTDEIALVKNTSQGLIIPIIALNWEKGTNVILRKGGFPANIYPWLYNIPQVEKRYIELKRDEDFIEKCELAVNEKTRAITVDWVDFLTGARVGIEKLGDFCQRRNILLFVDGIQGLGAMKVNLSEIKVDFFSSGTGKWLFGPQGIGIMYISRRAIDRLKLINTGWLSVCWEDFHDFLELPPVKNSAARYEEGTPNLLGISGLREHLKLILEIGQEEIEKRILSFRETLIDRLREKGCEILSPLSQEKGSGIVTFKPVNTNCEEFFDRLTEKKIIVSHRRGWIRVSPHFYNTEEEIEEFLKNV
ncbi:MAG: aminotransferase class V-fold PLP-dependent enzyme [Candidatus Cloacimonadota bacterium]|nr:MAG: aminotransferase class V-fold PLP-dependent enzyme [Candidatus Cloacimonadota bacterium]